MLNPLDREALKLQFESNQPYPHFVIGNFLEPEAALKVAHSYPDFEQATKQGHEFKAVNEQRKVQICDQGKFPEPVKRLSEIISSPEFLSELEYITGIPNLLADPNFAGGGMHLTGSGGRLDVHVDFNYQEDQRIHRRLNILIYLNPDWQDTWGGEIEVWDKDVKTCLNSMLPLLNRCLVFKTTDISYHGVRPITAPADVCRRSFAAYYYTHEAPPEWKGEAHSTIFKARPDEKVRGMLLMPAERLMRRFQDYVQRTKTLIKKIVGR